MESKANIYTALHEAFAKDYTLDFCLDTNGNIDCPFQVVFKPRIVDTYICPTAKANVHLIKGKNGKGTYIEFWDSKRKKNKNNKKRTNKKAAKTTKTTVI